MLGSPSSSQADSNRSKFSNSLIVTPLPTPSLCQPCSTECWQYPSGNHSISRACDLFSMERARARSQRNKPCSIGSALLFTKCTQRAKDRGHGSHPMSGSRIQAVLVALIRPDFAFDATIALRPIPRRWARCGSLAPRRSAITATMQKRKRPMTRAVSGTPLETEAISIPMVTFISPAELPSASSAAASTSTRPASTRLLQPLPA